MRGSKMGFRYRVLILTSWYPHPGQPYNGIFVKRKAEALKHRADVAVLFVVGVETGAPGYTVRHSREPGMEVWSVFYRRPRRLPGPLAAAVDRIRYLRASVIGLGRVRRFFGRPDLVHLHVVHPAGYVALALKLFAGIPYVLTEHCDLILRISRGLQRVSPASRWLMGLVIGQAGMVTVDSEAMREALRVEGFRSDAAVVRNIVERTPLGPDHPAKRPGLRLVHVSSLWDRQKNVSGLLRAVAGAAERLGGIPLRLDILGDGPDRKGLESLARELGLEGKIVRFHGAVDDAIKFRMLGRADCFVLSSNFEGFSVATAEALSAGLPVIVTDCGGPRDFVGPEDGIIVPLNDPPALVDAIVRMAGHKGRYSRAAIRKKAGREFDPETVVRGTLAGYGRVPVRWTAGLSWERISVRPEWLVLDVGSGHNPNGRADVLLDWDLEPSIHRTGQRTLVPQGRGMVVGDAARMPFTDKSFDFAIASHVAEHMENIEDLLSELQRVARRGYLETPGPLTEYLSNVPYHRWLVHRRGETLVFRGKRDFTVPIPGLFALFNLNDEIAGRRTYRSDNPWLLLLHRGMTRAWKRVPLAYVKHHWRDRIRYEVHR